MHIEKLTLGPFLVNTYIVYLEEAGDAVVIDPGANAEAILSALGERKLSVSHIFNTHGHSDHIAANAALKSAFPRAKIRIHGRDAHMLTDARANLSTAFGFEVVSPPAEAYFEGNTSVAAAGIDFRVEHVPGHSPGSVCLIPEAETPLVFTGDTLFAGSIGRTDFPGGNAGALVAGIKEKILTLPDDTVVYPGHGDITTVLAEREGNYYVSEPSSAP